VCSFRAWELDFIKASYFKLEKPQSTALIHRHSKLLIESFFASIGKICHYLFSAPEQGFFKTPVLLIAH